MIMNDQLRKGFVRELFGMCSVSVRKSYVIWLHFPNTYRTHTEQSLLPSGPGNYSKAITYDHFNSKHSLVHVFRIVIITFPKRNFEGIT